MEEPLALEKPLVQGTPDYLKLVVGSTTHGRCPRWLQ